MKYLKNLIVVALVVAAGYFGYSLTKKAQLGSEEVKITEEKLTPTATQSSSFEKTIGDFLVVNAEVCQEQDKPIIYFFGSSQCSHCVWEEPVMREVMGKFSKEISYHENIDTEKEREVFSQYQNINPQGYIPFLLFGCRYVRTGSGETFGKDVEKENLTILACKLTGGKPESVCLPLKEKISEVK